MKTIMLTSGLVLALGLGISLKSSPSQTADNLDPVTAEQQTWKARPSLSVGETAPSQMAPKLEVRTGLGVVSILNQGVEVTINNLTINDKDECAPPSGPPLTPGMIADAVKVTTLKSLPGATANAALRRAFSRFPGFDPDTPEARRLLMVMELIANLGDRKFWTGNTVLKTGETVVAASTCDEITRVKINTDKGLGRFGYD
jgi:hypothetical protein